MSTFAPACAKMTCCIRLQEIIMATRICRALLASAELLPATLAASHGAEARVANWLETWDSQGIHRTATAGDEAGAAWLAREAAAVAGPVSSESFPLERREPVAAYFEIDGARIDGEALFDGPDTPPGGVRGTAGDGDGMGPIVDCPSARFVRPWSGMSTGTAPQVSLRCTASE